MGKARRKGRAASGPAGRRSSAGPTDAQQLAAATLRAWLDTADSREDVATSTAPLLRALAEALGVEEARVELWADGLEAPPEHLRSPLFVATGIAGPAWRTREQIVQHRAAMRRASTLAIELAVQTSRRSLREQAEAVAGVQKAAGRRARRRA